jgi:hypothetical protein
VYIYIAATVTIEVLTVVLTEILIEAVTGGLGYYL